MTITYFNSHSFNVLEKELKEENLAPNFCSDNSIKEKPMRRDLEPYSDAENGRLICLSKEMMLEAFALSAVSLQWYFFKNIEQPMVF